MVTCPVLTKALATPAFDALLEGSATWLKRAWASTAGQHLLEQWGYDAATVGELQEGLRELGGRYHGDESD